MTEENKTPALAGAASSLATLDPKAAAAALMSSADEASTGGGDFEFLSFSGKKGTYRLGRDGTIDDTNVFILEPMAAVEGWNCWKGGKPVAKHEWSLYERASKGVSADDLAFHGPYNERAGEGWQFMLGIGMFDVDNPAKQIKFTTSSVSGRNVFSDLNKAVADELMDGNDGIMVFSLGSEEFPAHGQVNSKPKLIIHGFTSRAEVEAFLADDDAGVDDLFDGSLLAAEDAVEPEASEETPAPKAAEEKPAKGRRRRAAA